MAEVTRKEIFSQAAKKLRKDFEELKATILHAGLKGGEAEDLVRRFLQSHLPKRFDAGSGLIIDPLDRMSKQTDVIIYDALNCPVYRASEKAAILPSDNVAAVVEVKSRLDKEKMRDAFENARSVKGLVKTTNDGAMAKPVGEPDPKTPNPIESGNRLVTLQTLCCLFVFETSLTLEKLSEHYHSSIREYGLGRHIDMVLVLDKGVIMLATKPANVELGWHPVIMEGFGGPHAEGAHLAVATMPMKEDGLDFFLRFLLAHLVHFRPHSGHPGFLLKDEHQMTLTYLTSITHENDPVLRDHNLRRYADEVRTEFLKTPVPTEPSDEKNLQGRTASDTPDVIYLSGPKHPDA
jgi:hypothetical protein